MCVCVCSCVCVKILSWNLFVCVCYKLSEVVLCFTVWVAFYVVVHHYAFLWTVFLNSLNNNAIVLLLFLVCIITCWNVYYKHLIQKHQGSRKSFATSSSVCAVRGYQDSIWAYNGQIYLYATLLCETHEKFFFVLQETNKIDWLLDWFSIFVANLSWKKRSMESMDGKDGWIHGWMGKCLLSY